VIEPAHQPGLGRVLELMDQLPKKSYRFFDDARGNGAGIKITRSIQPWCAMSTMCIKSTKQIRQPWARTVFKALVETDIIEFKGQNPGFDRSPGPVLLETLELARTNEALTRQYDDRVLRLIYGNERPTYKEAFGTFELVARTLLEVM